MIKRHLFCAGDQAAKLESIRVAKYSRMIAEKMGLSEENLIDDDTEYVLHEP